MQAYQRRMWSEEMFGDLKLHGFDLESSHLRHFLPLSRLTLAVALLYVWLISIGSAVVKHGERHLVARADRRDLSIFQIKLPLDLSPYGKRFATPDQVGAYLTRKLSGS
ncbi:MAG: hypothetical protein RMN53_04265 [Anaerolineae bacterium]|nr:hypothetical protein [Anaerolineae bacterium]